MAVSIQRCGGRSGFLGKLGNDNFGRMLVRTLEKEKVEVLCPKLTNEAVTTLAFVSLDEKNDRTFTFARKPGADMFLSEEDVEGVELEECTLLHAGSFSQSAEPERSAVTGALKKAKNMGKMISFDVNYRADVWEKEDCAKSLEETLSLVDLLKISEEETEFLGGRENIFSVMEEKKIEVVVMTRGGDGAEIFYEGKIYPLKALKSKIVDTTGAGDSFWGAFLCRLLEQGVRKVTDMDAEKLLEAGCFGICAGGLCVQRSGGIPAIPYRNEIEEMVEKYKGEEK